MRTGPSYRTRLHLALLVPLLLPAFIVTLISLFGKGLLVDLGAGPRLRQRIIDAEAMRRQVSVLRSTARDYLLSGVRAELDGWTGGVVRVDSFATALSVELGSDPEGLAAVIRFQSMMEEWAAVMREHFREYRSGRVGAGTFLAVAAVDSMVDAGGRTEALMQESDSLVSLTRERIIDLYARIQSQMARSFWLIVIATTVALALGYVLNRHLGRRLLALIGAEPETLSRWAHGLARGDPEGLLGEIGKTRQTGVAEAMAMLGETTRDTITKAAAIASGDLSVEFEQKGPNDRLGLALTDMVVQLRLARRSSEESTWLTSRRAELLSGMQRERTPRDLVERTLAALCRAIEAANGAVYALPEIGSGEGFELMARWSAARRPRMARTIEVGDGIPGQAIAERRSVHLRQVPSGLMPVDTGFGKATAREVLAVPLVVGETALGVVLIGMHREMTDVEAKLVESVAEGLGLALRSLLDYARAQHLLDESVRLGNEVQAQSEELQAQNRDLEENSEELRALNHELGEQARLLTARQQELEAVRDRLESESKQLAQADRYKSEFLANVSHELRTPLNSLLVLAKMLADNRDGSLDERHARSADIIHRSGTDLLNLINDILDLSKIEANQVKVQIEWVSIASVAGAIRETFEPLARERGISFEVSVDAAASEGVETDYQRLTQILRNLVSNAVKFTPTGGVRLEVSEGVAPEHRARIEKGPAEPIRFAVIDTGIGVQEEVREAIFEPFRQADGSTSRRFGGTGLGLSISRRLTALLGGEILLDTGPGGSTFTLYLPRAGRQADAPESAPVRDDVGSKTGMGSVLIIEDDEVFASVLGTMASSNGFSPLIALSGTEGLRLAMQHRPAAILLDIILPDMDGLRVLDVLKKSPITREIPVHVISASDSESASLSCGAVGFLAKPVTEEGLADVFARIRSAVSLPPSTILIATPDAEKESLIAEVCRKQGLRAVSQRDGTAALAYLREHPVGGLIADMDLGDMTGLELLTSATGVLPEGLPYAVILMESLPGEELLADLKDVSRSLVVSGSRSVDRLEDEVRLFIHRLAERKGPSTTGLEAAGVADLAGKSILIVDDDERNLFSLREVLAQAGVRVTTATNGKEALARVADGTPDLVIMDIMMPVMDGYEAIRTLRRDPRWKRLPILAVTARAMREDRNRCLEAGATDYLTKPIDPDRLIEMIRTHLADG